MHLGMMRQRRGLRPLHGHEHVGMGTWTGDDATYGMMHPAG